MDFKQSLNVRLGLEQRLVMTQQLQQAIRLLQLSRAELADTITDALADNPVLEEVPAAEALPGEGAHAITQGEGATTDLEAPDGASQRHEIDWQNYFTDLARSPSEGSGSYRDTDEERPALAQTLTRASTLAEHLGSQLVAGSLSPLEVELCDEVIGNLDDDGYFRPSRLDLRGGQEAARRSLLRLAQSQGIETAEDRDTITLWWLSDAEMATWQELAEAKGLQVEAFYANAPRAIAVQYGVTEDEVWQAIGRVQALEPLGVASRDLRECLLVQARARYPDDDRLQRLCDLHLQRLADHDYAAVRRDLRCTPDELAALVKLLGTLEPRPGRHFSGETARYITPDVFVTKVGDDYVVTLNEDGLPKLRVSGFYKQALLDEAQTDRAHEQARAYLQDKLRAATWMIRSIHQRQSTIQRVTESIMRLQRPFLDGGLDRLRPLVLRDVAEDVGLHESTVSRVTTNKYVHTPQGIYELKFFFGSRITAQGGDDLAAGAVKSAIKKLIEREPPSSPLSDQEIAEMLQGEWDRGRMLARLTATEAQLEALRPAAPMSIARRTVAKYREQLGIAPSSRRRKSF